MEGGRERRGSASLSSKTSLSAGRSCSDYESPLPSGLVLVRSARAPTPARSPSGALCDLNPAGGSGGGDARNRPFSLWPFRSGFAGSAAGSRRRGDGRRGFRGCLCTRVTSMIYRDRASTARPLKKVMLIQLGEARFPVESRPLGQLRRRLLVPSLSLRLTPGPEKMQEVMPTQGFALANDLTPDS